MEGRGTGSEVLSIHRTKILKKCIPPFCVPPFLHYMCISNMKGAMNRKEGSCHASFREVGERSHSHKHRIINTGYKYIYIYVLLIYIYATTMWYVACHLKNFGILP